MLPMFNHAIISNSPESWAKELAMLQSFEFKPGWSKGLDQKAEDILPYVKEIMYQTMMHAAIIVNNTPEKKTRQDIIKMLAGEAKFQYEKTTR